MPTLSVRPEGPLDGPSIEHLLDRSFGADRFRKVSYRYRFGVPPVSPLCLVAEACGAGMVGAIRYWPLSVQGTQALLLGPLAIDPDRRGVGIGRILMYESMSRATQLGWPFVFLVGDIGYYRQFGFGPVSPALLMPGETPNRVLGRPLASGSIPDHGTLLPLGSGAVLQRRAIESHERGNIYQVASLTTDHGAIKSDRLSSQVDREKDVVA